MHLCCVQTEQRVRDNADWLFKCIAEAHTILTDPTERQELDSGLARQERHQRARAGSSYRPPPTPRQGSPHTCACADGPPSRSLPSCT